MNNADNKKLLFMQPMTWNDRTFRGASEIMISDPDTLIPFTNHPFKLYDGQRLEDLIESVRKNGILVPIVIRPASEKGKYEILSGHNRVVAAKAAGVKQIPAYLRYGLTDAEALLIVTETNLLQRSFNDLKCSERAAALSAHYEAIKKNPGYRSDLLDEIEELSGAPVGPRMKTRDKLGKEYGIGKTTIIRYLHINMLIPELKERLDNDEISMRAADSISFLQTEEQLILEELLSEDKTISMKQAESLRSASKNMKLDKTTICRILTSQPPVSRIKPIKLSRQLISKYFNPEANESEIEDIISKALEQYFTNRSN